MRGLVERDEELGTLAGLVDAAGVGRGGLVLVEGPAGIGKTRLLAAVREIAREREALVLTASGAELERDFPFGAVRQLLDPLIARADDGERARLFRGGAAHAQTLFGDALPSADADYATLYGLYWLLVELTERRPTLIAIDDVHWADVPSLRFLAFLARRLDGMRLLVTGALRPAEPGTDRSLLSELALSPATHLLRPAPLTATGAEELIRAELAAEPEPGFVAECQRTTGGNPLYLRALLAEAARQGVTPTEGAKERVRNLGPEGLSHRLLRRLEALGPGAPELARALAILGDGAPLHLAGRLAGLDPWDVAPAAAALQDAQLTDGTTFTHPVVRTSIHRDISAALRAEQHGRAARLLAEDGADPDRVAAQLLLAAPEPWAVEQLRGAARTALARGAPENAAAYLRHGLQSALDPPTRATLLRELAAAEAMLQDAAAIAHLQEAQRLTEEPRRSAEIAGDLIELLVYAGQWDAAVAAIDAARARIGAGDPLHLRLDTMWAASAAYDPRRYPQLEARMDALRAAADDGGTHGRELSLLLAAVDAGRGERIAEIVARVDRALDDGRLLADTGAGSWALPQATIALLFVDDIERATALSDAMLRDARARGSVRGYVVASGCAMFNRTRAGDLNDAEVDLRTLLEIVHEHGLLFGIPSGIRWGIEAVLERPDLADVAAFAGAIELPPGLSETVSGAWVLESQGRLRAVAGDRAGAAAAIRAAGAIYGGLKLSNPAFHGWRSTLALNIDDPDEALALVREELDDAQRIGLPRGIGVALRALGLLTGDTDALAEAVVVLAGSPARLEHARAQVDLGAALRRANHRTAARERLREGLDEARRCGATRLAERAAAELRATGARPRSEVLTGPAALTASERRTAEMAATGLSNAEIAQALFVTVKTVEGHLSGAYRKLDVRSRAELPGALQSRG